MSKQPESLRRRYWAGYVEDKIDASGWTIRGDVEPMKLVSVFSTRKAALDTFRDVRAVYIVPADIPKKTT